MFDPLRRIFRLATGRARTAEDAGDELALHLELRTEELIRAGLTPEAARAEALRRFGDPTRIRSAVATIDRAREADGRRASRLEDLRQDLRFAWRTIVHQPGFAAASILTLGLGVGATTAILSIVNGVIVRPLPYPAGDRTVAVWTTGRAGSPLAGVRYPMSAANFSDLRLEAKSLAVLTAFRSWQQILVTDQGADLVPGARVSAGFFEALGERPALGRSFTAEDERPGAAPVVVISEGLWRRRFGADSAIIGRSLPLSGTDHTVVGVMPAGFHFPRGAELPSGFNFAARTDLWAPLQLGPGDLRFRGAQNLAVLGLPRRGLDSKAVQADLALAMSRLAERYPEANANLTVGVASLLESGTGTVRPALLVLLGAVAFLLLIACVNVSNLLLTRTAARRREVAIRGAMGAARGRLLRQFVTENILLTTAGGLLGVFVAVLTKDALLAIAPVSLPRVDDIAVDWRVLVTVLGIVLAVGVGFGLLVAAEVAGGDQIDGLREGSKGSGGRGSRRLRNGLVVAEIAISAVLLTGAGALGKTFLNLQRVDPGFDPTGVLTARVSLPLTSFDFSRYAQLGPGWTRFFQRLTDELGRTPGVRAAAVATSLPLSGQWENAGLSISGRPPAEPGQERSVRYTGVSDDYFAALGIPLQRGRWFGPEDRDSTPGVVINEAMARRYWPGADPLGSQIRIFFPQWLEVVGVVADVRSGELADPPEPMLYLPLSLYPGPAMSVIIEADGDPNGMVAALRAAVRDLDPGVPVTDLRPMEAVVAASLAQQRFSATLVGAFAIGALALAVLGLYAVISFGVTRRRREIGVRLALGAEPGQVLRMVIREGAALAAVGVVVGLLGSVALGQLLSRMVYGTGPSDPTILGVVGGALMIVSVAASAVPARRAVGVSPVRALREE